MKVEHGDRADLLVLKPDQSSMPDVPDAEFAISAKTMGQHKMLEEKGRLKCPLLQRTAEVTFWPHTVGNSPSSIAQADEYS